MADVRKRVKMPKTARPGEIITVKTRISHPMENGHRRDRLTGEVVPRKIINRFTATYEGHEVVDFDLGPSVSSNPYFKFQMRVPGPGLLHLEWTDDDGTVHVLERRIEAA